MPSSRENDRSPEGAAHFRTQPSPSASGVVIPHATLTRHEHHGDDLVGVATPALGAREHEVWRSSIGVGQSTPLHSHESEEIFVFLRGTARAHIGDRIVEFTAPATIVAPAGVPHRFFNTGDVPTDAIVVLRLGSAIWDEAGEPMHLPWRR